MRIALFASGFLAAAAGTLLYQDDRKRLQSRLEDLWILADDLRPTSETWLAALVAAAATTVLRLITRLFDEHLMSPFAVAGALITSSYSLVIVFSAMLELGGWHSEQHWPIVLCTIATIVALWFRPLRIAIAISVVIYTGWLAFMSGVEPDRYVALGIYIGAATDIAALMLIRRLLSRFLARPTLSKALGLLVFNTLILCAAVLPLIAGKLLNPIGSWMRASVIQIVFWWACSNAFVALAASAISIVLLTMVLHRLVWPLSERLIYNIAELRIFEHRERLVTIGIALMCASAPQVEYLISTVRKMLGL